MEPKKKYLCVGVVGVELYELLLLQHTGQMFFFFKIISICTENKVGHLPNTKIISYFGFKLKNIEHTN